MFYNLKEFLKVRIYANRGFPSLCSRKLCLVWCCFISGAGAKTFFTFIFLVDLKHGAICQTILECSLATIF